MLLLLLEPRHNFHEASHGSLHVFGSQAGKTPSQNSLPAKEFKRKWETEVTDAQSSTPCTGTIWYTVQSTQPVLITLSSLIYKALAQLSGLADDQALSGCDSN